MCGRTTTTKKGSSSILLHGRGVETEAVQKVGKGNRLNWGVEEMRKFKNQSIAGNVKDVRSFTDEVSPGSQNLK